MKSCLDKKYTACHIAVGSVIVINERWLNRGREKRNKRCEGMDRYRSMASVDLAAKRLDHHWDSFTLCCLSAQRSGLQPLVMLPTEGRKHGGCGPPCRPQTPWVPALWTTPMAGWCDVCSLEFAQVLTPNILSYHKIILILRSNKISMMDHSFSGFSCLCSLCCFKRPY